MTERMSASEWRARSKTGTQRVKGAKRTVVDGIAFDSKREAARWQALVQRERAGEISDLQRQVAIPLNGRNGPILTPTGRHMTYRADFTYRDNRLGGALVIEDAKGHPTEVYTLKRAILAAQGVEVQEV